MIALINEKVSRDLGSGFMIWKINKYTRFQIGPVKIFLHKIKAYDDQINEETRNRNRWKPLKNNSISKLN